MGMNIFMGRTVIEAYQIQSELVSVFNCSHDRVTPDTMSFGLFGPKSRVFCCAGVMITLLAVLTGMYAKRAVAIRIQQQQSRDGAVEVEMMSPTGGTSSGGQRQRERERDVLMPCAASPPDRRQLD